jgi:dipeptidyl aminopeptidase/acylaminoacyl peptidase
MKQPVILACLLAASTLGGIASAQPAAGPALGLFQQDADVGATAHKGAVVHDAASGSYRITGGGANIWAEKDAFHYLWTQRSGDLHIAADIAWLGAGTDPHRKAGVMIRQNLTPGSPYADVMVHGDGLVALQYREVQDGPTRQIVSDVKAAKRVQLEREGDYVFFSVSGTDGKLRHAGGNYRIAFQAPYLVGLAVSAHDDSLTETANFSNVELKVPNLAYVPDTGYPARVEATLEVMEIGGTRSRRVVRQFDTKIEAPNWSRDGKSLIYNAGGLIWRIPVEGGEPEAIETGPNSKNNNDHGLSPDGSRLMISDQSQPDNVSRIYTLPLAGSKSPVLVAGHASEPSYWHAWTPDGKTIAYTARRPETGDFDIYAKDLPDGKERRLTQVMGLDDGPEYTPDGRYLYFNSTRSGAMQIWRANADGSAPEQVTRDPNFRDWFPHFSPDGKQIAFISFGLDVALNDHPPNRDVMLRLMPADGSAPPEVLTRLFGGQGTINVPSWSPDGKSIAFVSYRLVR